MQALLPLISSFSGDIKNLLGEVGKEFTPEKGRPTMGLYESCSRQNECSNTGIPGGPNSPALGGKVGCCPNDEGKTICQFKRPDYLGISYCPLEAKASLFLPPGSVLPTVEEIAAKGKHWEYVRDRVSKATGKDVSQMTDEERIGIYDKLRAEDLSGFKPTESSKFPEIFSGVLGKLASTAGVPGVEEISKAITGAISALPGGKLDLGKIAEFVKGSLNNK